MTESGSGDRGNEGSQTGQKKELGKGVLRAGAPLSLIPREALQLEPPHRAGPVTRQVLVSVSHRLRASLMGEAEAESRISPWAGQLSCASPGEGQLGTLAANSQSS